MQNLRPGQSLMVGRHAKLKKNCEKLDFCALCFASTNSKVNGNKGETTWSIF